MRTTTATITVHAPSRPGLTYTVEYPSGVTKEWTEATLISRGIQLPSRRFTVTNDGVELVERPDGLFEMVS